MATPRWTAVWTQRPGGAVGIVDRVENGGASAQDLGASLKIMTFYVNKAPRLQREIPAFTPDPNAILSSRTVIFNMPATDVTNTIPTPPSTRWEARRPTARSCAADRDPRQGWRRTRCDVGGAARVQRRSQHLVHHPVDKIAPGNIVVRVRLCDCADCDNQPGTATCPFVGREGTPSYGSCVDTDIPCRLNVNPEPAGVIGAGQETQRPGSPSNTGRRQ
jgi:hypothetical protein